MWLHYVPGQHGSHVQTPRRLLSLLGLAPLAYVVVSRILWAKPVVKKPTAWPLAHQPLACSCSALLDVYHGMHRLAVDASTKASWLDAAMEIKRGILCFFLAFTRRQSVGHLVLSTSGPLEFAVNQPR